MSDRAYPTLLHARCSLTPGGIVLRRLGSCLVVVFLAVAGICRASRIHGHLGIVEVKSKSTRHAGRVEDDSVARKRRTVLSLAVDEMASSVPPSYLVSLAPGAKSSVSLGRRPTLADLHLYARDLITVLSCGSPKSGSRSSLRILMVRSTSQPFVL